MYVITNRNIEEGKKGLKVFGDKPNVKGPNELRITEVFQTSKGWEVTEIKDELSIDTVKALKRKYRLPISIKEKWYGSLDVACRVFEQARAEDKSVLFYIHGYNNDMDDILKAAYDMQERYNVIVVPISWPANGGGIVSGTAAYLSDKSDARASAGAVNRAIGKIHGFHQLITEGQKQKLLDQAREKHSRNPQAASELFAKLLEKHCPTKISLLCHSMGNYVLKHTLKTSDNVTSRLIFDNICLVAADTNTDNHKAWVGEIDVRNRLYVVINENDFALRASRIKPGDEQKARLGHCISKLDSPNAIYIDVTDADHVGSAHGYFAGKVVEDNTELEQIFDGLVKGRSMEGELVYLAANNSYRLPD